jgi:hypothetical protein
MKPVGRQRPAAAIAGHQNYAPTTPTEKPQFTDFTGVIFLPYE